MVVRTLKAGDYIKFSESEWCPPLGGSTRRITSIVHDNVFIEGDDVPITFPATGIERAKLSVFVSNDFDGPYPVGTAAVIFAPDAEVASRMLTEYLQEKGLDTDFTLREVTEGLHILNNGEY